MATIWFKEIFSEDSYKNMPKTRAKYSLMRWLDNEGAFLKRICDIESGSNVSFITDSYSDYLTSMEMSPTIGLSAKKQIDRTRFQVFETLKNPRVKLYVIYDKRKLRDNAILNWLIKENEGMININFK
ncbi:hypothetical protein MD535_24035 [Vibrio sp. ZSDZ65]|uniref:Uncharacterized protein n=1 Tax=Vibrio qingdaonensis TaxID=2829491 RepID=A0A9X3CT25_9VIBR|nr:hypothetical protein [Vibrio qingdaonensis]MCW8349064.1 hypothetical protein [Vibrio qingdaonensis]